MQNWKRFSRWEERYEEDRLREFSPLEKLEIYEEFYKMALAVQSNRILFPWNSDEEAKKNPHLKYLINFRKTLLRK